MDEELLLLLLLLAMESKSITFHTNFFRYHNMHLLLLPTYNNLRVLISKYSQEAIPSPSYS
jgi:hypothetical protein